jgi:GTPase
VEGVLNRYPSAIPISAKTGFGIANLSAAVSEALSRNFLDVDVEMNVDNGRLMAYLAAHGEVLAKHFCENRVIVRCRIAHAHLARIDNDSVTVRPRCGKMEVADALQTP